MKTPLWFALILAILSGFALAASFPAANIWVLAIVAVTGFGLSLLGRNFWTALIVGFVFGATFWLSLINWLTLYLGAVPWLALAILQALFISLSAGIISIVLNRGNDRYSSPIWRVLGVSSIAAALWVARELLTSVWPYGGFSWGKLSYSQSESPFSHLLAWIGDAGLSFVIAVIGFTLVQVIRWKSRPGYLIPFLLCVAVIAVPTFHVTTQGQMKVLAVQGNSKAGLFDHGAPGAIMSDHVSGTLAHLGTPVDVIVWPENAADINPLNNPQSAQILDEVSQQMNAPVVTGAITNNAEGQYFNSSLVWQDGLRGQYDKIHPVPFAEYMPDRSFWRFFQPDLVDLVTRNYSFGTRPNVIKIADVPVGISICFDITDDAQIQQMISGGAQIIFAQTNNADFGRTSENLQQLAIAKIRAIESGRSVVNISTVGTSAILDPQGKVIDSLPAYEAGEMVNMVPLSKVTTAAMLVSPFVDFAVIALGLLGLLLIVFRRKF